jgi:ATP-binding cassette subfamily F protein 3
MAGEQQLRSFLGQWYFVGDRAFENVDGFSGGERARLALALIAYLKPNVLLLDEPTNHLDLDMREALAEALSDFDGAIVLVSHDRHLIGLVCDKFVRVADGKVEPFDGDLDEYAAWLRSRSSEPKPKADAKAAKPATKPAAKPSDADARRLKQLESRLAELSSEAKHIADELADPGVYNSDGGAVLVQLTQRQARVLGERETVEAEWLALAEALEAAG